MAELTIPELLADITRRRGISDRQLAAFLEASTTAVNRWRHGQGTPDPKQCWKIARLAGLEVEEVMRMADHLPPLESEFYEPVPDEAVAIARELRESQERFRMWIDIGEALLRRQRGEE